MIQRWLNRWAGTPEEVARRVQSNGLVRSAQLASSLLGEAGPTPGELPEWLEEVLEAVLDQVCRYDDSELPRPDECGALESTTKFLRGVPAETEEEFQSLLVLIELSPYVLGPRRYRFTELKSDDRDQLLRRWEQSPLPPMRAGFNAVKSMAMMGYWSCPQTWSAIGYSVHDNPGVPKLQQEQWERRVGEEQ